MRLKIYDKDVEISSSSIKGKREENQDAYGWYLRNDDGTFRDINGSFSQSEEKGDGLFIAVVCDGMGGLLDGAMASNTLVNEIVDWAYSAFGVSIEDYISSFRRRLSDAEKRVMLSYPGSGTTLSMVISFNGQWHSLHIGDSRCYLVSPDRYFRTVDQSVVEQLFRKGDIEEEEMNTHMLSNLITDFIGGDHSDSLIDDNLGKEWDSLTLCSDGAFGYMGLDAFKDLITGTNEASVIVDKAFEEGSTDNITVLRILRC